METTLGQDTDKGFHENLSEAKKDKNDPLAAATTFEDLMRAVSPRGRWALRVVVLCALGTYTYMLPHVTILHCVICVVYNSRVGHELGSNDPAPPPPHTHTRRQPARAVQLHDLPAGGRHTRPLVPRDPAASGQLDGTADHHLRHSHQVTSPGVSQNHCSTLLYSFFSVTNFASFVSPLLGSVTL